MDGCSTALPLVLSWAERLGIGAAPAGCRALLFGPVAGQPTVDLPLYVQVFALTLALEAPAYYFFWRLERGRLSGARSLARRAGYRDEFPTLLLAVNAATHPLVVLVFPSLAAALRLTWAGYAGAAELFAWLVEAALLACVFGFRPRAAVLASLAANLSSFVLGGYAWDAWHPL